MWAGQVRWAKQEVNFIPVEDEGKKEQQLTSSRYSAVLPSSSSCSRYTSPRESTTRTLPFSATTRFFVPVGPLPWGWGWGVADPEAEGDGRTRRPLRPLASFPESFLASRSCILRILRFIGMARPSSSWYICCGGGGGGGVGAAAACPSTPGTLTPRFSPHAAWRANLMYRSTNSRWRFQLM